MATCTVLSCPYHWHLAPRSQAARARACRMLQEPVATALFEEELGGKCVKDAASLRQALAQMAVRLPKSQSDVECAQLHRQGVGRVMGAASVLRMFRVAEPSDRGKLQFGLTRATCPLQ